MDNCSEGTSEYLSLHNTCGLYNGQYFLWSVCVDSDCNKRGQTSRSVVGTEIQTICNFKANLHDLYYLVGFACSPFSNVVLEALYNLMVWHHMHTTVSYNLHFLLHKDISHPPSSSKSSPRPCSTTEPNKSTEHSEIQKGSVHSIWLQLMLVACYLPYSVATALVTSGGRSLSFSNTWNYAVTLVFLNLSLNPILFCWKMEEVRKAVKNTIRQVICLCFSS